MKNSRSIFSLAILVFIVTATGFSAYGQTAQDEKAVAVITKAIKALGGDNYIKARTQVSRGSYTILKQGTVVSFQTFTDAIVYPDRERTDFKDNGVKTVQV